MKPNKPVCFTVFFSANPWDSGTFKCSSNGAAYVHEEVFNTLYEAECFASLQAFAIVVDTISRNPVCAWHDGKKV